MMKYTIFFLLLITFFCCKTKNEELIVSKTNFALSQIDDSDSLDNERYLHSNKINLNDLIGTYQGVFPCTNCNGIETIISLYKNKTYYLEMNYLGTDKKKIKERGLFEWIDNENNIYLKNKAKMEFKVGEDRIWLVNSLNIKTINLGNNTNFILQKK